MIEFADTQPGVNVSTDEYTRLLGYPRGWTLRDRALELSEWARTWYGAHGHPWMYAREAQRIEAADDSVLIDQVPFTSTTLLKTLREAGAHGAVVAAAGAGPELEDEAQRLWQDGRPDEYFFLEVYGSAVVEHLITMTGARLCARAETDRMAVLPHYSPGYPDWPIEQQARLLTLIKRAPRRLEVLESGMLRPKKSLLAVFGLTRHVERVRRLTDLIPCERCSYAACQYRRLPYRRPPAQANPDLEAIAAPVAAPAPDAQYSVNIRALRRWADERLSLERQADGTIDAQFRYEGTTCTNMGRPIEFHYQVTLDSADGEYRIREQRCAPAPADEGHASMCRYLTEGNQLLVTIAGEKPLLGRPLHDVLSWPRPLNAAGCYCEADARQHKWGLVLETIHYALSGQKT